MFLRWGKIPEDERSVNYRAWSEYDHDECDRLIKRGYSYYEACRAIGKFENGVSVLDTENPTEDSLCSCRARIVFLDPCYVVTGNVIGKGADGEPLLKDVIIVDTISDTKEMAQIINSAKSRI